MTIVSAGSTARRLVIHWTRARVGPPQRRNSQVHSNQRVPEARVESGVQMPHVHSRVPEQGYELAIVWETGSHLVGWEKKGDKNA